MKKERKSKACMGSLTMSLSATAHTRWVRELMQESGVCVLPQNVKAMGRTFDSRDFWSTFDLSPIKVQLDQNLYWIMTAAWVNCDNYGCRQGHGLHLEIDPHIDSITWGPGTLVVYLLIYLF